MRKSVYINCALSIALVFMMLTSCQAPKVLTANAETLEPDMKANPEVLREFRAAWIATVANINWPSAPGLTTAQQQAEAVALLDLLKNLNYNAVIFQARPQADAMYPSTLEPWSFFLTGAIGKAPDPYYDPLDFWIEAAHDRGMELHVWLNPYRAHHFNGGAITENSLVSQHPEFNVKLENGMWWMDPSKQATQDHSAAVVMDLVKRYDVDGIHFDDYFYPYASYNNDKDFPDAQSYQEYLNSGGALAKADWRRAAVNTFVARVYQEIKAEKPEVKFGISPFGIWRPGYPASIAGMDQYNELYADAKLWLNKGWIDYFTPQLYWKINQAPQSFPVLLGWWNGENTQKRHLWPGMSLYSGGDAAGIDEVINQIMITRGMVPEAMGTVHWSIKPLITHPDLAQALVDGPYKQQALVPASPWLDNKAPKKPSVSTQIKDATVTVSWRHQDVTDVFNWVVFYNYGSRWEYKIMNRKMNTIDLPLYYDSAKQQQPLLSISVSAVDRTGNQSDFQDIKLEHTSLKN